MQSKWLWLLIQLFLFSHLHANHAEDQTRCERLNGVYVLDKKTLLWGCYTLAYSIGDRAETSENRKKCEYADKLYGWNGSQYDCFFPNQFISQPTASAIPPQTYTNATLERRALCEQNGNTFIWDSEENTWTCRPMAYRINDRRINPTNQSSCESNGNQYLWDGKYYHCIGTKPIIPPKVETKLNDTLLRREKCEKKGDTFTWNGIINEWECISNQISQVPNETLQRRETCEKSNKKFEWNGAINQWECINPSVLTKQNNSLKILETSSSNIVTPPIDASLQTTIPYNEAQEKRAICEQRGFVYTWNGNVNEWQCFSQIQKFTDEKRNEQNEFQCSTQGYHYLEANNKWQCLKLIPKPETKKIDNASLEKICQRYNGSLQWISNRWICVTKSSEKEIKNALTPSFKSPTPLVKEKSIFNLDNQKTEEILNFDFSDDGKYLTTHSVNPHNYVVKAYKLPTMEPIFSLNLSKNDQAHLHKSLLFIYGHSRADFEVIDLVQNKSLLVLPDSKIQSIAITNDDKFLILSSYKNLSIYDTKNWKLHCSIPVRRVDLGYRNILDISKPLFYENVDGQKAALNIATGQNITPLPSLPPRFGYEIRTLSPDSLPVELNATKNKLYYSSDFHYAIEAGKESFNIWDLEKKVIVSTKNGILIDYPGSIKTTKNYAIFHAIIGTRSTYLLDFNNPSALKQLTYSTQKPLHYKQQKASNILETGGKVGWDLNNALAVSVNPLPKQLESAVNIQYFSDGKHAAIAGGGNQVLYYDLLNNKELAKFGGGKWTHETTSTQIELSPDESKIVATANHERDIIVWDVNQSKIDYTIPNSAKWGNPFVITSDSKYIIALSYSPTEGESGGLGYHPYQGTLNVWNFKTGVLERSLPKRATTFALIPKTHLVALGEKDGTISLWDYRNGMERFRLTGHENQIENLTFIDHGHTLLSRDAHSKMIRWENIQNKPRGTKMWHGIPHQTELSHKGNYMLIADQEYKKEGKIRLLNLKTSQYEYEFPYPVSYSMRKVFSFDDKYFFLSTPENATKVFETATGKELATLQAYDNGEWIILTPQGYFNASKDARKFIIDTEEKELDDATYQKYFNPDKVKNILNGIQK